MKETINIIIMVVVVFCLGAWAHEGDIQRACKDKGETGGVTLRGELICNPKENQNKTSE